MPCDLTCSGGSQITSPPEIFLPIRIAAGSAQFLITERAAVLARIGTAGQGALVPVDPDRLRTTEWSYHAGSLVPEFLQALDDVGGDAILELIDALIVQASRHIDRFLHVAAIVENVGQ